MSDYTITANGGYSAGRMDRLLLPAITVHSIAEALRVLREVSETTNVGWAEGTIERDDPPGNYSASYAWSRIWSKGRSKGTFLTEEQCRADLFDGVINNG